RRGPATVEPAGDETDPQKYAAHEQADRLHARTPPVRPPTVTRGDVVRIPPEQRTDIGRFSCVGAVVPREAGHTPIVDSYAVGFARPDRWSWRTPAEPAHPWHAVEAHRLAAELDGEIELAACGAIVQ